MNKKKYCNECNARGMRDAKKNKNKNRLERIIRKIKHERVKQARI
jgi:hypothetical protein